jgi:hypothetical protein
VSRLSPTDKTIAGLNFLEQSHEKSYCRNEGHKPKDPLHDPPVSIPKLFLQAIGFRLVFALSYFVFRFFVKKGIVEHDISPSKS